jgi:hypothetical protein
MTSKNIIENELRILECAKAFRRDANALMEELSKDFNFSLDSTAIFPSEVYCHKYNNKGIFRNEWTYYFHGSECRFDNLKTGQVVEFIIVAKPEFGFLDGYFFYNYMATTHGFKDIADWFVNSSNVWTAIEVLADKGSLKRMPVVKMQRNVIAID